ncbi:YfhO family protein [Lactiplantibacillus sp. WILCCON 0030]|uniref:YfhO family protein n=1 Tax=Lactiplantibacillus brownii TaxID=3069269 RepID=A0ABU1A8R6_9LACO|nr:YfhO family protein [Lactiplantibacillus brownii]MDQ7937354.1 YfhO family protein [Lactiplantibacillus brownii]
MQTTLKSRWQGPLISGCLALVVVSSVLWYQQITPFGDHNFLISDMGSQYLSFFTAYRHAWLSHNFQLYSFSQSLGGSMVPTLAYYLMSPFNLLILVFPANQLLTGISFILILKIVAIAVTTTFFLQAHFHQWHWSAAWFGLAFSLCGFVALNYFDIMWLDALIWLPLVLHGLDRLLATGHSGQFFWWLWVSIVTDFYLGYMTCLFTAYYLVYQLFDTKQTTFWADVRQRWHLIRRVIITGLLSVLSSVFILIPTIFGMLQTAKSQNSWTNFLPLPTFGPTILSQFGLGANNFSDRLTHAPTVFTSTVVTLLVLCFFVHPKLTLATKQHAASFLGAMLLSMGIEGLNTVWHLFQQAAGFPFRNAFFFSFIMVMLSYQSWLARPRLIAKRWQLGLPLILGGGLILGWCFTKFPLTTLGLSLSYLLLAAVALFATKKAWQAGLIVGLMTTELGLNFSLSMGQTDFGRQSVYQKAYTTESQQMDAVNDPDGQLYRVDDANTLINRAYRETYDNYNDPMLFNFHDIDYYSSTLNEQTRTLLQSLGLYSHNVRRISSVGLSPVTELLLGIKYNVNLRQDGDAQTRLNPSYVGFGFVVPNQLTQLNLKTQGAITNQEAILQQLKPQASPYFLTAKTLTDRARTDNNAAIYPYQHKLKLQIQTTGPLFYSDPTGITKYSTMQVNGRTTAPIINANHSPLLWELGTFKKGDLVTVSFKTTHANVTDVELASLDTAKFEQLTHQLKASAFVPTYHARGFKTVISGQLNNTQNRRWLYLALPYDSGWVATVNGQTAIPKPVLTGLTAIPITAGQTTIRLQYHVRGLRTSSLISGLAILLYLGLAVWWRVTDSKKNLDNI